MGQYLQTSGAAISKNEEARNLVNTFFVSISFQYRNMVCLIQEHICLPYENVDVMQKLCCLIAEKYV